MGGRNGWRQILSHFLALHCPFSFLHSTSTRYCILDIYERSLLFSSFRFLYFFSGSYSFFNVPLLLNPRDLRKATRDRTPPLRDWRFTSSLVSSCLTSDRRLEIRDWKLEICLSSSLQLSDFRQAAGESGSQTVQDFSTPANIPDKGQLFQ